VSHWTQYTADYSGPSLAIAAPADGSIIDGASVAIQGTAADASGVAVVEARINNGTWTAAEGTEAWSVILSVPAGNSTITVRATDEIGCAAVKMVNVTRPGPPISTPTPMPGNSHGGGGGGEPVATEFVGVGRLTISSFGVLLREATIRSDDARFTLHLPAGTRIRDAAGGVPDEVSLRPMLPGEMPYAIPTHRISEGFILEPRWATFDPPMTARYAFHDNRSGETAESDIRCFVPNGSLGAWDELPVSLSGFSAVIAIDRASEIVFVAEYQSQATRVTGPAVSAIPTESLPYPTGAPEDRAISSASPFIAGFAVILASAVAARFLRRRR
jgi:hypothetical protein